MTERYEFKSEGEIHTVGYVGKDGRTYVSATHRESTNNIQSAPVTAQSHAEASGISSAAMAKAIEDRRARTGEGK